MMDARELDPAGVLDRRPRERLRGKVAIVTGAGQGIGRATVRRLAAEAATVAVVDLNDALASEAAEELRSAGGRAAPFVHDLCSYQAVERLVAETLDAFGQIDVLVNNVGGATALRPFWEWEPEDLLQEVHRSLLPTAWCCRAVLPHMLRRRSGRIVNVGAESVRNGLWDRAPYNMAKGAVHALTTSIARETATLGVTCNCVAPAATGSSRARLQRRRGRALSREEEAGVAAMNERTLATIPMGRVATDEEQAAAIAFLASDDASFITGQVLSVNGGSSML